MTINTAMLDTVKHKWRIKPIEGLRAGSLKMSVPTGRR